MYIAAPAGGVAFFVLIIILLIMKSRQRAVAAAALARNAAAQPFLAPQPRVAAKAAAKGAAKAGAKKAKKANKKLAVAAKGAEPVEGVASISANVSVSIRGPPGGVAPEFDSYGEGNEHPEGVGGYYRHDEENGRALGEPSEDDGTIG